MWLRYIQYIKLMLPQHKQPLPPFIASLPVIALEYFYIYFYPFFFLILWCWTNIFPLFDQQILWILCGLLASTKLIQLLSPIKMISLSLCSIIGDFIPYGCMIIYIICVKLCCAYGMRFVFLCYVLHTHL